LIQKTAQMDSACTLPKGLQVLERGWLSSNNILLTDENTSVLIDSGYVSHAPQTLALVQQALGARPLHLLLNTHLHSDHCGGNRILQDAYPLLETRIPPGMASEVAHWDESLLTYKSTGQNCPRFAFDALIEPGTELTLAGQVWEVHAAPGHDPHSVILYQPVLRILISADALWEHGFGIVFPELDGIAAFQDVAKTLDLIESLQPLTVIPGHGRPFNDVSSALAFARRKLNGYIQHPDRHALYGAKVLIKFKLLEWGTINKSQFRDWTEEMGYLHSLHQLQAPQQPFPDWTDMVLSELVKSKALQIQGETLTNI
jgi:glyoxylase-like metal-dependent hydrolase (beta-lactamase superfamily II)